MCGTKLYHVGDLSTCFLEAVTEPGQRGCISQVRAESQFIIGTCSHIATGITAKSSCFIGEIVIEGEARRIKGAANTRYNYSLAAESHSNAPLHQ